MFRRPPETTKTSGRRLVLANWIASTDNRLTARVMMNRIWQHYFGRGIVRSPNNFGLLGDRPTHPELLDWLAIELMNGSMADAAGHSRQFGKLGEIRSWKSRSGTLVNEADA